MDAAVKKADGLELDMMSLQFGAGSPSGGGGTGTGGAPKDSNAADAGSLGSASDASKSTTAAASSRPPPWSTCWRRPS